MPYEVRTDLVISMTLAEIFLLLLFVVWYGVVPNSRVSASDTTPSAVLVDELRVENAQLKSEIQNLTADLENLRSRLQWWRTRFGVDVPGSEKEWTDFFHNLGRGRPACQPEENVFADVAVIDGYVSMRLVARPQLLVKVLGTDIVYRPNASLVLTRRADIDRVLQAVTRYRRVIEGQPRECRFDYRLTWATYEDYHDAREQFERYFYPAGTKRSRFVHTGNTSEPKR